MAKPTVLNVEKFQEEVLEAELPVIIDFYSEGCGPCIAIKPVLEELAEELDGKLIVKMYKTEASEIRKSEIIKKYKVMAFPTLLIFKNGELNKTLVGYYSKTKLLKELEGIL